MTVLPSLASAGRAAGDSPQHIAALPDRRRRGDGHLGARGYSRWTRNPFLIASFRGHRLVDGYVQDGIGIHRQGREWTLTHLLTGCGFHFNCATLRKAKALADRVLAGVPGFTGVGVFGNQGTIPYETAMRVKAVMVAPLFEEPSREESQP